MAYLSSSQESVVSSHAQTRDAVKKLSPRMRGNRVGYAPCGVPSVVTRQRRRKVKGYPRVSGGRVCPSGLSDTTVGVSLKQEGEKDDGHSLRRGYTAPPPSRMEVWVTIRCSKEVHCNRSPWATTATGCIFICCVKKKIALFTNKNGSENRAVLYFNN